MYNATSPIESEISFTSQHVDAVTTVLLSFSGEVAAHRLQYKIQTHQPFISSLLHRISLLTLPLFNTKHHVMRKFTQCKAM